MSLRAANICVSFSSSCPTLFFSSPFSCVKARSFSSLAAINFRIFSTSFITAFVCPGRVVFVAVLPMLVSPSPSESPATELPPFWLP